jgi:glyoxylase-like metal-dependent hydrolase (beta-lactamase superfamily II)
MAIALAAGLTVALAGAAAERPAEDLAPPPVLEAGVFPSSWYVPQSQCASAPAFRIHSYNRDFVILRQSGCTHFEKPFLYLIFGTQEALLVDTGAPNVDIVPWVEAALRVRDTSDRDVAPLPLLVVHSHGHGDHTAGTSALRNRPGTRVVDPNPGAIASFFGLSWPTGVAGYDLGNRIVDIVPIPGHEGAHIAVYDRRTGILLTGDTIYPGRLYVSAQQDFRDSIARLVDFTRTRPVAHLLGAHIEQARTPFLDYPVGTQFQPEEHVLELGRSHLLEIHDALSGMPGAMARTYLRDMTIWPF